MRSPVKVWFTADVVNRSRTLRTPAGVGGFNRFAQTAGPAPNLEASCGRGIVVVGVFVGRTYYHLDLSLLFVLSLRVLLFYSVSLILFIRGGSFYDPE